MYLHLEAKMSEILDHIKNFLPVYRVLNREENLNFFRDVLGLKVHLEEGAMVWLGGNQSKENCFLLEESPEVRTVRGNKKHSNTILTADEGEIEQLLARHSGQVENIFTDGERYGFEAISPEHDHFLLLPKEMHLMLPISADDIKFEIDADFKGLSGVKIKSLDLNVSETGLIDFISDLLNVESSQHAVNLPFVRLNEKMVEGSDLQATADETLDLEFLVFIVDQSADLIGFSNEIDAYNGIYLDKAGKTLSLDAPNNMEIWFVKN